MRLIIVLFLLSLLCGCRPTYPARYSKTQIVQRASTGDKVQIVEEPIWYDGEWNYLARVSNGKQMSFREWELKP